MGSGARGEIADAAAGKQKKEQSRNIFGIGDDKSVEWIEKEEIIGERA